MLKFVLKKHVQSFAIWQRAVNSVNLEKCRISMFYKLLLVSSKYLNYLRPSVSVTSISISLVRSAADTVIRERRDQNLMP